MPLECERIPDRFPIASAAVPLSDMLAFVVELPGRISHPVCFGVFKLKECAWVGC